ncbi:MAG: hypothetical protein NDF54_11290 [archaeon GB-1867-035]|nr:hypothetical protein [Candidatus Culexmicrobium profundum]
MAGIILIYEKSLGRPTFLLLSFFDPLFHALNPTAVETPFAIILSPKNNEIVNSTEVLVMEKKPFSQVKFVLKLKDKVISSIELTKISDKYWFANFPSNFPANIYNAELIFIVGSVNKIVKLNFVYLPFIDVYKLFNEVWSLNGIKVYRLNVKYADELKLDEHYSPPKKYRRYGVEGKFDRSLILFPLILVDAGKYNTVYKLFVAVPFLAVLYHFLFTFILSFIWRRLRFH